MCFRLKLSEASGSSLGYGTTRPKPKKLVPPELSKEDDGNVATLQGILAG